MLALELKHITKSYRSREHSVTVLQGLSFSVQTGEFIAIVGGSGQGKSTLLNILGCLDQPDSGTYLIDGEKVNWDSKEELARVRGRKIATIFQSFELISHWTVLENVEMCLRFRGVAAAERSIKAMQALRQVGILQHSRKFPYQLSGGEQQRCAIARALCANPSIILADEPTGNLDPSTANSILELLISLKQQGSTIVFVTHDHALAKRADRVAVLQKGRLEWWSPTYA